MNKYSLVFILLAVMAVTGLQAQESYITRDHRFNIEVGGGIEFGQAGARMVPFDKESGEMYFEFRYRNPSSPWSVGVNLNTSLLSYDTFYQGPNNLWGISDSYNTVSLMATVDWNRRLSKHVSLFAGFGLGVVSYNIDNKEPADEIDRQAYWQNNDNQEVWRRWDGTGVTFMPRVGLHAWNVVRLTAGYKWRQKTGSQPFVTLGLTFGFGKR